MTKLNDVSEEYCMKINTNKTKVVALAKKGIKKVKIKISSLFCLFVT